MSHGCLSSREYINVFDSVFDLTLKSNVLTHWVSALGYLPRKLRGGGGGRIDASKAYCCSGDQSKFCWFFLSLDWVDDCSLLHIKWLDSDLCQIELHYKRYSTPPSPHFFLPCFSFFFSFHTFYDPLILLFYLLAI